MGIHKYLRCGLILASINVSACGLDDVLEKGSLCPDSTQGMSGELTHYVYFDQDLGTVAQCKAGEACFTKNVITGHCPFQQQYCHQGAKPETYYCSECGNDSILCGLSNCINPMTDHEHCGASGLCNDDSVASENYRGQSCQTNETCKNGVCVADSCSETSHLYDGKCEDDTVDNCGSHGNNCADVVMGWETGQCTAKKCEPEQCVTGFHLEQSGTLPACTVDSVTACGSEAVDCTKLPGWEDGKCDAGQCKVLQCQGDYHIFEDQCTPNDVEHCGGHISQMDCTRLSGWEFGMCVAGQCVAQTCSVGYHVEETIEGEDSVPVVQCVSDSVEVCGNELSNCKTLPGWQDGICRDGLCKASECIEGYHLFDGVCSADDVEHCGGHDDLHNCTLLDGWADGQCLMSKCSAFECEDSYHLAEETIESDTEDLHRYSCELDTESACGDVGIACSGADGVMASACINKTCIATLCQSGYHLYNDECIADSLDFCGGHDAEHNCNALDGWQSGTCENANCIAKTCESGYFLNAGVCSKNDVKNCGKSGNDCSQKVTGWGNGSCSDDGKCVAQTCKDGYHLYNQTCEIDNNTNCGSHNVKCAANSTSGIASSNCEKVTTNGSQKYMCVTKSCMSGYHKYTLSGIVSCEMNNNTNCGSHGSKCNSSTMTGSSSASCTTNGVCNATACSSGYHLYSTSTQTKCEANTNTNCGTHGTACKTGNILNSTSVSCSTGTCIATSCQSGYHLYNNGCEEDTPAHCGASRKDCNYLWFLLAGAFCINGVCCSGAGVCY